MTPFTEHPQYAGKHPPNPPPIPPKTWFSCKAATLLSWYARIRMFAPWLP